MNKQIETNNLIVSIDNEKVKHISKCWKKNFHRNITEYDLSLVVTRAANYCMGYLPNGFLKTFSFCFDNNLIDEVVEHSTIVKCGPINIDYRLSEEITECYFAANGYNITDELLYKHIAVHVGSFVSIDIPGDTDMEMFWGDNMEWISQGFASDQVIYIELLFNYGDISSHAKLKNILYKRYTDPNGRMMTFFNKRHNSNEQSLQISLFVNKKVQTDEELYQSMVNIFNDISPTITSTYRGLHRKITPIK